MLKRVKMIHGKNHDGVELCEVKLLLSCHDERRINFFLSFDFSIYEEEEDFW